MWRPRLPSGSSRGRSRGLTAALRASVALSAVVASGCAAGISSARAPAIAARPSAEPGGRDGGGGLELQRAFEVSLDLGSDLDSRAFAARSALAELEQSLRGRGLQVVGPSSLLEPSYATARTEDGAEAPPMRMRLRRRLDLLGWFFSTDNRQVRLVVGGGDLGFVRQAVRDGLTAMREALPRTARPRATVRPLWPMRAQSWVTMLLPLGLIVLGAAGFWAARRGGGPRRLPLLVATGALLSVPAAWLYPRFSIRFGPRGLAPLAFVAVRADIEDPAVLREVRRLTERARLLPGVAGAWSVSDLFAEAPNGQVGIPSERDGIRAALDAAASDPAVGLELTSDRRQALVAVRFEEDSTVAPEVTLGRVQRILDEELRTAWSVIDLRDRDLDPATRLFGQGVLAGDVADRIVAICRVHGKRLGPELRSSVLRVAREAVLVRRSDSAQLRVDVAGELRRFLADPASPPLSVSSPHVLFKMADLLSSLRPDAGAVDVAQVWQSLQPVASARGVARDHQNAQGAQDARSLWVPFEELAGRVASVKHRHSALMSVQAMLSVLDLPAAGPLADDVRAAVLDGVGPFAVIPLAKELEASSKQAESSGGHLSAALIGAHAEALQVASRFGRIAVWGVPALVLAGLLSLLLIHGAGGLPLLFVATAPAGAALLTLALLREPLSPRHLSLLVGALLGGFVLAAAPTRRGATDRGAGRGIAEADR